MPQHEAYRLSKHGTTAERLVTEDFKKAGFKFREEDFNLVLTHSPYSLVNSVIFEKFPDFFKNRDPFFKLFYQHLVVSIHTAPLKYFNAKILT